MKALQFWKTLTRDDAGLLGRLVALMAENAIHYCVIGDVAVNAYSDPVVGLDFDVVVAPEQVTMLEGLLRQEFEVKGTSDGLGVSVDGSNLRVQIQTQPRYAEFVDRASPRDVLGLRLPVAAIEDVLQGKVWAVSDTSRRASKRQKDLADIARLIEARPEFRDRVPREILDKLI
jgi:hypothetical protein